jgi:hypothetical protein
MGAPGERTVIDFAWTAARGWAAAAKHQQGIARREAKGTLALAAAAALLAAIVGGIGETAVPTDGSAPAAGSLVLRWTTAVSLAAGFLAAASALWGRYVQQGNAERRWVAARAAAELIQSECYRFAAGVTPYAQRSPEQATLFSEKVSAAGKAARETGAMQGEATSSTERPAPEVGMSADWYQEHRLIAQRKYYTKAKDRHAKAATSLRRIAFGFGILAALLGFGAAVDGLAFLAAGVGAVTTIAGGVAAYSNVDRNAQLALKYSEMAEAIDSLLGRHKGGLLSDADLVDSGETLLASEYAAWQQLMLKQDSK